MKKSLKTNYIYNLLYQLIVMVLPLITTPYLSRVLGAEKIGIYSFTMSILSYFVLFGCMGINLYGQREIAMVQNDVKKRSKIFYELVILKLCLLVFSYLIFALFNFNDANYGIYYKILSIELFSNAFDITWFFQGIENFKKITIRNTLVRLISLVFLFLFVKNSDDLIIYFLINCLTNLFGFITLWINFKKYVNKSYLKKINIFKHIKPVITLFIPQIAIQIYTVLDKTMLGYVLNDMSEVGYYEQSQKIVKMLLMIIVALGAVVGPRIANLYANKKYQELQESITKVFNVVCFISLPMCFGLIAVSKNFVPWFFGNEFSPIINLLSIFSFLLVAIGLNNITGVQYLIPTRQQKKFTISVVIGALINLILNFIFIPKFKAVGAALSSIIAEFTILGIHIWYLRKSFDFKKILRDNVKYLLYSIIMFICILLISNLLNNLIIITIIQFLVGIFVYILLLIIFKDKIIIQILNYIKNIFIKFKFKK